MLPNQNGGTEHRGNLPLWPGFGSFETRKIDLLRNLQEIDRGAFTSQTNACCLWGFGDQNDALFELPARLQTIALVIQRAAEESTFRLQ
jgi:hypothetical protein